LTQATRGSRTILAERRAAREVRAERRAVEWLHDQGLIDDIAAQQFAKPTIQIPVSLKQGQMARTPPMPNTTAAIAMTPS
jgi:hypothetical protein